jgi:hypothetical protein
VGGAAVGEGEGLEVEEGIAGVIVEEDLEVVEGDMRPTKCCIIEGA